MKLIKLLCVMMLSVTLYACTPTHYTVYTYQMDSQSAPYSLNLDENNHTFQFVYTNQKYLPYGSYKEENGKLTLKTSDMKYYWVFERVDENHLKFIAEESIPSIIDGTIFTKTEE